MIDITKQGCDACAAESIHCENIKKAEYFLTIGKKRVLLCETHFNELLNKLKLFVEKDEVSE